jgi:ornithine lipid ester-linked acyl 2-hydroxylase
VFEDPAQYPFALNLERNWQIIRDEMIALRSTGFMDWPEKSLYGETGWSTFGLYAFGQKQAANCALCPRTSSLMETIPGLATAGFSRLAPGAHIKPHVGYDEYSRYVLRLHLPLKQIRIAPCALLTKPGFGRKDARWFFVTPSSMKLGTAAPPRARFC